MTRVATAAAALSRAAVAAGREWLASMLGAWLASSVRFKRRHCPAAGDAADARTRPAGAAPGRRGKAAAGPVRSRDGPAAPARGRLPGPRRMARWVPTGL